MERKAQNKGRGQKRKSNQQDVEETENPQNKEAESSKSKVVPTFNKKRKVTKKQERYNCKSNGVLPNTDDQQNDPNQDREEEVDTKNTAPDDSQLQDTANSTSMLEEQTKLKDISCPSNIESEDMNKCSKSESSCKSSEKVESSNTTEVSIEDPLPACPSHEKSKVVDNMSDKENLDSIVNIEHQSENKTLQSQSNESAMMAGLIGVPQGIKTEHIEISADSTELPAKKAEFSAIGRELDVKDTEILATIKKGNKDNRPLVQLIDLNKESNESLEQMHIKQETMTVVEENSEDKEEDSLDKQKSHTVQQCGVETPEAVQSEKEITLLVSKPQDNVSNPAADPLRKVDQQDSLEQTGSSNQVLKEAEQSGTGLIEKESAKGTQEFKTTDEATTVVSNENHFESQPLHKDIRKCFSLNDNDIGDQPKDGDMEQDLISTCIEEQEIRPIDSYGEHDVNKEQTDLSNKEKKSLLSVSSPENIRTDMTDKPPCADGLEGDMDITDSQLCEAVNIQESNGTISSLEEVKKRHVEGRKIIRDLIVDLSYLNKMLLRTKREIESARRRKIPVGNGNSW